MKYDTQNPNAGKIRRSLSTKTTATVLALLGLCYVAAADGVSDQPFKGPKDWSFYASGGPVTLQPQETSTTAIDVGRQLFVDDYLISETTLVRSFHTPRPYEKNPILKPETKLELDDGNNPVAAPFIGGAWYDPQDNLFKLWYLAGWEGAICYAESKDGMTWNRPSLDVVPGSNRVLPIRTSEDGHILGPEDTTVWLDLNATDPAERYKMSVFSRRVGVKNDEGAATIYTSPDGIHWKDLGKGLGVKFAYGNGNTWYGGDDSNFYYDPFRKLWVYTIRERAITLDLLYKGGPQEMSHNGVAARYYYANADWWKGFLDRKRSDVMPPSQDGNPPWLRADDLDRLDSGPEAQLSDFAATPYESILIGDFYILARPAGAEGAEKGGPNPWDIKIGYSRDGYHWERPTHTPFIASSRVPNTWNRAYMHPASGLCMVVGDELYFYFGAWSGESPNKGVSDRAGGSTALAILRRDGFASMDAGETPGTLTTTPISFKGKYPFVNAEANGGELRMEVLDADGKVIAPYSLENCIPVKVDSTHAQVEWKGGADLAAVAGKPVRFRFELTNGKLYSFWVSPDLSGASYGYVAAGGPGFTGPVDNVGEK